MELLWLALLAGGAGGLLLALLAFCLWRRRRRQPRSLRLASDPPPPSDVGNPMARSEPMEGWGDEALEQPFLLLCDDASLLAAAAVSHTWRLAARRAWRGRPVPVPLRARVWAQLSGAVALPEGPFDDALPAEVARLIELDVQRMAEVADEDRAPLQRLLRRVAARFPDVGYCQGMHAVGALLLDVCAGREERAAGLLAALVERYDFRGLFDTQLTRVLTCCASLEALVEERLPSLAVHMAAAELQADWFATGWFVALFADSALPRSRVLQVWDAFLVRHAWSVAVEAAFEEVAAREGALMAVGAQDGAGEMLGVLKLS